MEKDNKKIVRAWSVYDLANSVYNLVITATIFPIYYNLVTTTKDAAGNEIKDVEFLGFLIKNTTLYDYSLAFAYLVIASIAPLLSGIADYGDSKKKFMQFFSYLGAASCSLLYFFNGDTLFLGVLLSVFACIGYSGSLVFYNAYLPEISSPENQDKISARGYAMGYWGSSILLIINLIMVMTQNTDADKIQMMRYSFITVGLWWFGFSQIPFAILPDKTFHRKTEGNKFTKGYLELRKVWLELKNNKRLTRFLTAFFTYNMGVQTIMLIANHFGAAELKMKPTELITTILIIQFLAMIGSFLFSYVSKLKGNIFTLKIATLIWAAICILTFLFVYTASDFYVIAAFVGLIMGGIQSLSRSTYSKMLPETEDHASYFSFYDVSEKISIVMGMLIFGFINENSSTMRTPILALLSFFVLGFLFLLRIPKENKS